MSAFDRTDQFIQFDLQGFRIAVLRILDQENHQEGNDRGACVDHQLPGVTKVKNGTGNRPEQNNAQGDHKCAGSA